MFIGTERVTAGTRAHIAAIFIGAGVAAPAIARGALVYIFTSVLIGTQRITAGTRAKAAIKYDGTNAKFFVNGSLIDTITPSTPADDFNRIAFDRGDGSQSFWGTPVHQTLVFDSALTDAECIALTTI